MSFIKIELVIELEPDRLQELNRRREYPFRENTHTDEKHI
jgi:hypothetical protein